jgi:hypothetical protein
MLFICHLEFRFSSGLCGSTFIVWRPFQCRFNNRDENKTQAFKSNSRERENSFVREFPDTLRREARQLGESRRQEWDGLKKGTGQQLE